jgi:thymidylate kinase
MFSDQNDATANRPFLITFSGIDGAGKTTQIDLLTAYLQEQGLHVLRLSFWDDVAVWPGFRAGVGKRTVELCRPDQSEAVPFSPKNNKHIRKWYLTGARLALYPLDAARLCRLLESPDVQSFDVVIFDRYIYDQIANICSRSSAARMYRQILLKQIPSPDLAFILDSSPRAAFARKPEYPLEFLYENRRNFLSLRELVPQLIVISDAAVEEVRKEIQLHVRRSRLAKITAHHEEAQDSEDLGEIAVIPRQSSCRVRNEPTALI